MSVLYIKPVSPDSLIERYGEGSAAPAKLAHINYLQDTINEAAPYTTAPFVLNHPLGQSATIIAASADLASGCNDGCYRTKNGDCLCFTIDNSVAGVYNITSSKALVKGFNLVASPLKTIGKAMTYEYVSSTEFTIKTYDVLTGNLENNILENTYIELKIWN